METMNRDDSAHLIASRLRPPRTGEACEEKKPLAHAGVSLRIASRSKQSRSVLHVVTRALEIVILIPSLGSHSAMKACMKAG